MSSIRFLKARPWLATAVTAAAVAVVLIAVPVSYTRTIGHDVALDLASPGMDSEQVRGIAKEFKAEMGAEAVVVEAENQDGVERFTLRAAVPANRDRNVVSVAGAFAAALNAKGYAASAKVTPKVERVWGNVYAMARDAVIRIEMEGKSDAELAAEIRQKLEEAGVPNPEVSVVTQGDDKKTIKIEAKLEATSDQPLEEGVAPTIIMTKNGQDLPEGSGVKVREEIRKRHDGETVLVIEVTLDGKVAKAEVKNPQNLGDDALAAEVKAQLAAQGLTDIVVTASGGKVTIQGPNEN